MILDRGAYRRVVTQRGLKDYEQYMASGLHRRLGQAKLILDHADESAPVSETNWARLLTPEQLTFISYPYEWSFDELRDAAMLTLKVQENALASGMSLKDASPYNVQFRGSNPVFIDTLSFENNAGGAWIAYEQFCRQFLAPLLLMSYGWSEASQHLRVDLNGFPLAQASRLLPPRSYLNVGALLHVHFHARSTRPGQASGPGPDASGGDGKAALAQSLYKTIDNLRRPPGSSEWTSYYHDARYYTSDTQESKRKEVAALAAIVRPDLVYDLGANTGLFSRALALDGAVCIAFERDTNCVNRLYLEERSKETSRILPLVMDLENPSPGLGFGLNTTLSLADRPQADLVLCLAIIHHLRFSANLPLWKLAAFMARLGRWLLIEFVPAEDPASQMLINGRDGFDDYTPEGFLEAFSRFCDLRRQRSLQDSARALYLFERRG